MSTSLESELASLASGQGFHALAVASPEIAGEARETTRQRVREGSFDGLPWFDEARVIRATDPRTALDGIRSVIMLAASYGRDLPRPEDGRLRGRVSRYAWGRDYHNVLARRVRPLLRRLEERVPGSRSRFVVDHAPFLERPFARRAGIGWQGKNTMILARGSGSWTFLGAILTTVELEPDTPVAPHCGACSRCLPACPTGALRAPYDLVNDLCISFQTIENRGVIPRAIRSRMKDWIFGCDLCQEDCPVNDDAPPGLDPFAPASPEDAYPDLEALLGLDEDGFRERFRGRALLRARYGGLLRNACVALGNLDDGRAIPALERALGHRERLVRGHAAWALGRLGARRALESGRRVENDAFVAEEIAAALEESA